MIPITVFNILPRSNCFYWAFWLWKPFFHCKQSGSSQWALAPSGEKCCALVNNSENLFIPWICWSAVLVRGLALQREGAAAWLFAIRERLHFSSELNQQVLTSPSVLLPAGLELSEQRGWLRKSGHRPRGPNTLPCRLNTREILTGWLQLPCSSQVTSGPLCHQSYWNEPPTAPHLDFDKVRIYSWTLLLELTFSFLMNFCWLPSRTKGNLHSLGNVIRMTLQTPEFHLKNMMTVYEQFARESLWKTFC